MLKKKISFLLIIVLIVSCFNGYSVMAAGSVDLSITLSTVDADGTAVTVKDGSMTVDWVTGNAASFTATANGAGLSKLVITKGGSTRDSKSGAAPLTSKINLTNPDTDLGVYVVTATGLGNTMVQYNVTVVQSTHNSDKGYLYTSNNILCKYVDNPSYPIANTTLKVNDSLNIASQAELNTLINKLPANLKDGKSHTLYGNLLIEIYRLDGKPNLYGSRAYNPAVTADFNILCQIFKGYRNYDSIIADFNSKKLYAINFLSSKSYTANVQYVNQSGSVLKTGTATTGVVDSSQADLITHTINQTYKADIIKQNYTYKGVDVVDSTGKVIKSSTSESITYYVTLANIKDTNLTTVLSSSITPLTVKYKFQMVPVDNSTPTIAIDADPQSVKKGDSYIVKDLCLPSTSGTKITKWKVKEVFTPKTGSTQTLQAEKEITDKAAFFKSYIYNQEGKYTYTITSATDDKGKTATNVASVDVTVSADPPTPTPPPAEPDNKPPVASINAPTMVTAGYDVTIDGTGSYDPDGTIVDYQWSLSNTTEEMSGAKDTVWFNFPGTVNVTLTVVDDKGATGTTTRKITVLPPTPGALITYTGKLTENHKITVSSLNSFSPPHFPIDPTLTVWELIGISGCTADDIKYNGVLTGVATKDWLSKKAGTVKIKLKITNTAGYSSTAEIDLPISPDLPPIPNLGVPGTSIRDQTDSSGRHFGLITCYDLSSSPDGDPIGRTIVYYRYDSDNDGDFNDETRKVLYDSDTNPTGVTTHYIDRTNIVLYDSADKSYTLAYPSELTDLDHTVGKTTFDIYIEEVLDVSNTIPEFISPSDIKKADTFGIN